MKRSMSLKQINMRESEESRRSGKEKKSYFMNENSNNVMKESQSAKNLEDRVL